MLQYLVLGYLAYRCFQLYKEPDAAQSEEGGGIASEAAPAPPAEVPKPEPIPDESAPPPAEAPPAPPGEAPPAPTVVGGESSPQPSTIEQKPAEGHQPPSVIDPGATPM